MALNRPLQAIGNRLQRAGINPPRAITITSHPSTFPSEPPHPVSYGVGVTGEGAQLHFPCLTKVPQGRESDPPVLTLAKPLRLQQKQWGFFKAASARSRVCTRTQMHCQSLIFSLAVLATPTSSRHRCASAASSGRVNVGCTRRPGTRCAAKLLEANLTN